MKTSEILKDIGKRTNGDIYLGVVGPVRVGKSTFIKRFMELVVIPLIENPDAKKRAIDELPQSQDGNMIMTVEPKFVPNTAVSVPIEDYMPVNIRLVDCVGFVVAGSKGYQDEQGQIRLVKTPWFLESIPFDQAAKIGTQKVIEDHSTIGIVLTSDGSFTNIERKNYELAEAKVVSELQEIGKPFIIILNTNNPEKCTDLVNQLTRKYNAPVIALNVLEMDETNINNILKMALYEFPLNALNIQLPRWIDHLEDDNEIKKSINETINANLKTMTKLKDIQYLQNQIAENKYIESVSLVQMDLENGIIDLQIKVYNSLYTDTLYKITGEYIEDKSDLLDLLKLLTKAKKSYESIEHALAMVKSTGYGFSIPTLDEFEVSEPVVTKQGARYGIKMSAKASTIHMLRVDVHSTFEPIIGTKEQSEDFVDYLNSVPAKELYDCEIFGRKLGSLINEGIHSKLSAIPENAREKIHDILGKIVNKGKSNVIAVVL